MHPRLRVTLGFAAMSAFGSAHGQIDVSPIGTRTEIVAGIASRSEYRDFLLRRSATVYAAASIAAHGFSASAWISGDSVSEMLVGYSHKLPVVDLHIAYVVANAPHGLGGQFLRIRAVNNNSRGTVVSFSGDWPKDGPPIVNLQGVHELAQVRSTRIALAASVTRVGTESRSSGSLRLLASTLLHPHTRLDLNAGYLRAQAVPDASGKGPIVGISLSHVF